MSDFWIVAAAVAVASIATIVVLRNRKGRRSAITASNDRETEKESEDMSGIQQMMMGGVLQPEFSAVVAATNTRALPYSATLSYTKGNVVAVVVDGAASATGCTINGVSASSVEGGGTRRIRVYYATVSSPTDVAIVLSGSGTVPMFTIGVVASSPTPTTGTQSYNDTPSPPGQDYASAWGVQPFSAVLATQTAGGSGDYSPSFGGGFTQEPVMNARGIGAYATVGPTVPALNGFAGDQAGEGPYLIWR